MEYYSSLDASKLDSEIPTIFELISAGQLEALLSPSLRYILVHYASRHPRYLLKISNRFDELNFIFRTAIEWYFIKYWQGTFTENFYGLKRVSRTPLDEVKHNQGALREASASIFEQSRSLSGLQEVISLFEITGTAYLSEKFNYWYELWYPKYIIGHLEPASDDAKEKYESILKKKFVEIYPTLQSGYRLANFVTMLLYLGGKSSSPSVLTLLFRIKYARLNQYDYSKYDVQRTPKKKEQNIVAPPSMSTVLFRALSQGIFKPSWRFTSLVLGTFFPVAIFSLKFLEWYNNSDFAQSVARSQGNILHDSLPLPASLAIFEKRSKSNKLYKSGQNCPLCKGEIKNPAIIETGYVFCYSCIYTYLMESHKIVSEKLRRTKEISGEDSHSSEDEDEDNENNELNIEKGGRCPITGKKLLGCKWNALKGMWEIEGIRRLIF